jgi:hypothetical protein
MLVKSRSLNQESGWTLMTTQSLYRWSIDGLTEISSIGWRFVESEVLDVEAADLKWLTIYLKIKSA